MEFTARNVDDAVVINIRVLCPRVVLVYLTASDSVFGSAMDFSRLVDFAPFAVQIRVEDCDVVGDVPVDAPKIRPMPFGAEPIALQAEAGRVHLSKEDVADPIALRLLVSRHSLQTIEEILVTTAARHRPGSEVEIVILCLEGEEVDGAFVVSTAAFVRLLVFAQVVVVFGVVAGAAPLRPGVTDLRKCLPLRQLGASGSILLAGFPPKVHSDRLRVAPGHPFLVLQDSLNLVSFVGESTLQHFVGCILHKLDDFPAVGQLNVATVSCYFADQDVQLFSQRHVKTQAGQKRCQN